MEKKHQDKTLGRIASSAIGAVTGGALGAGVGVGITSLIADPRPEVIIGATLGFDLHEHGLHLAESAVDALTAPEPKLNTKNLTVSAVTGVVLGAALGGYLGYRHATKKEQLDSYTTLASQQTDTNIQR